MKKSIFICPLALTLLLFIVSGALYRTSAQRSSAGITDIDGNRYRTVMIGDQEWFGDNLKVTRLNDGTEIPNETESSKWVKVTTPAYSWYDNDISNKKTYGALYNWHAVKTDKLCPVGWRVATDADWEVMSNFLGGAGIAGGKLKEAGTANWTQPNLNATNETGFLALPGGYRWSRGKFDEKGMNGYWWSGTECTETHSWSRTLYTGSSKLYRSFFLKNKGFSVRCIKVK